MTIEDVLNSDINPQISGHDDIPLTEAEEVNNEDEGNEFPEQD